MLQLRWLLCENVTAWLFAVTLCVLCWACPDRLDGRSLHRVLRRQRWNVVPKLRLFMPLRRHRWGRWSSPLILYTGTLPRGRQWAPKALCASAPWRGRRSLWFGRLTEWINTFDEQRRAFDNLCTFLDVRLRRRLRVLQRLLLWLLLLLLLWLSLLSLLHGSGRVGHRESASWRGLWRLWHLLCVCTFLLLFHSFCLNCKFAFNSELLFPFQLSSFLLLFLLSCLLLCDLLGEKRCLLGFYTGCSLLLVRAEAAPQGCELSTACDSRGRQRASMHKFVGYGETAAGAWHR